MKKSDEFIDLEKRCREMEASGSLSGEALSLAGALLDALKRTETRLGDLEDRLMKLEDFSDIISMDIYDIQSLLLKKAENLDDLDFDDDDEHGHHHHHGDGCDCGCEDEDEDEDDGDEDENETSFIRCPFCNTVIFINTEDEELSCPFCGEKFLKSDVEE